MLVLKPIISILLPHMFNIGRMLQVGTVRIVVFNGPDPDRGPPFERRGLICFGQVYDESIEYRVLNPIQVSIDIVEIRYRTSTNIHVFVLNCVYIMSSNFSLKTFSQTTKYSGFHMGH